MANTRKGVPAGWTWRDGRPRWIPSPTLRKAGWKGLDLKDKAGAFLARGASIDRAQAITAAVAAWRAGQAVPADLAPCAPDTALAPRAVTATDRRAIGALLDAYLASREFEGLAPKTQQDRRSKLSRMVDVLAGYVVKPPPAAAPQVLDAYAAAREKVRGLSITVLAPPPFDEAADADEAAGPLYTVYWRLREKAGAHMAHGVLADVSAWLKWCRQRGAIPMNWAQLVDRETPPGRIRVGTWDELAALIKAAEAMGLHSIADAIILGVDLSWSQCDRLSLRWSQIDGAGRIKGARQKTGRKGETPTLTDLAGARLPLIKARQRETYGTDKLIHHVLICEATGAPWKADHYRHKFAEVREAAAADCPSVADFRDQDLRDTAITVAFQAGLTPAEIASRSMHSLKRIHDVLDKHYVELGQEIADAGALKLNTYLADKGVAM